MPIPVLVVDGDPELASLIRRTLEKDYACTVAVAASSSEALAAARAAEYRLVIVDLDLPDVRQADLVRRLRSLQPGMLLLALASDPSGPAVDPLGVHATVPKPFYLPDLMAQVQRLLSTIQLSPAEAATARADAIPNRLGDAAEAARLVARGARDSGAYLVLLTRDGRRWVHAGPMPPAHVEQVVAKIQHYGIRTEVPGAVARYLRLPGANDAFLLYCLPLAEAYLLAILYPSRVPFSSVRRQAERLAELLSQPPAATAPARPATQTMALTAAVEEIVRLPRDWMPQAPARRRLPFLEARPEASEARIGEAEPDPAPPLSPASNSIALPGDWLPRGGQPPVVHSMLEVAIAQPAVAPGPRPAMSLTTPQPRISLVYVPRDPALALQGALAATLVGWTKQICRALGFHPVDIHVRPDALCLTAELPATTSPPTAAHRVRQELSRRIAETYPSQAAAAASGRFWTSRYLLMSGEPPSSQRITEFVRETRGSSRTLPASA